ncbi:dual specificity protein phosphatase family protein [Sulfurimonas sp.]|uniref:dual specificity protein phosphatase family protein n=1 Tax=Sulfurimonas sp. TaxID=2022749 RepID=UPI002AB03293|nr:dual specificity protein phosphatase family protein [Sulfurimonas sp.]
MKKIFKISLILVVILATYYVYHVHFDYRFEVISKDKVYKSGLIKPEKLEDYLVKYNIKTVIDLMDPGVQDALNPAKQKNIDEEDNAINQINKKNNLNIKHVNIPSGQVPNKKTLTKFFEVLDNKNNYPILIHCYHGTGRAQIYSALYRVEYENWNTEDARQKTRFMVEGFGYRSSFSKGKVKGDFLIEYKPREEGIFSTINTLQK